MIIRLQNKYIKLTIDSLGCTLLRLEYLSVATWINTILSLKETDYAEQDWYCGAIIGRFSNRIKGGTFDLEGKTYHIPTADEGNALHGNHELDRTEWSYNKELSNQQKAVFSYHSVDGEHGFPATVKFLVTISIYGHTVEIDYKATSNQNTPLSLTHHPYFNLNENHSDDISNHEFQLDTQAYLELNQMIPTGKVIKSTTFNKAAQLNSHNYDDCFIVDDYREGHIAKNASIINRQSGIQLDILSDLPSFQFYTAEWVPEMKDIHGDQIGANSGFCIEPEYYPDSPNQSDFPSCIFGPDRPYHHIVQYKFISL